jgi:hypothetical protein
MDGSRKGEKKDGMNWIGLAVDEDISMGDKKTCPSLETGSSKK